MVLKSCNLTAAFALIIYYLTTGCTGIGPEEFVSKFNALINTPDTLNFSNDLEINNSYGHLQGIQSKEGKNNNTYFFLSGSSETYSYCVVVKTVAGSKVHSVHRLMEKPFVHAGGFQIFKNYLAVGIEDNSLKDKSNVHIYDVSNPEEAFSEPISVIERRGGIQRNTAGCVGITGYKNKILIAVGNWDTKHIDFYTNDIKNIKEAKFNLIFTIDTENMSKEGWVDNNWLAYQNINLFNVDDKLFLIGLAQNTKSENIADLYLLTEGPTNNFKLKKLSSKTFNCTNGCNFKAGAGVNYQNGELQILACGYNIHPVSTINIFNKK